MRHRLKLLCCALLAALGASIAVAARAETAVDVNLVLAVDTSGSVNAARYELQRQGYAAAFRNPRVWQGIAAGAHHAIAVTMMQWTGPSLHAVVVDWTLVQDQASAEALASRLESLPRQLFGGGTSLSGAIDYSMQLLARSPYKADRQVIDVSGDGSNNRGRPAEFARDAAVKAGAVINGLPILALEPDLDRYYRESVIGGTGAFVVVARSYDDFAEAVLEKLVNEVASNATPPAHVARTGG
ncbi:MAG: DUF1194 domain-containing protein [Stellaceae bacterium]